MPNVLTGDFDVVAEFAIPAINRLLAAMHRIQRFPHSASMRVDDTHPPDKPGRPSAVEIVDAFGDATVNPGFIRTPSLPPGMLSDLATNSRLGAIVNTDVISVNLPPITPSHFKGRAQLQFSPPTMDVAPGAPKIKVRLNIMARYLPDPGTSPAAEFVRGELDLTAPVNHVASQVANVLSIDIKANSVEVAFTPTWSSVPLSASDRAGIDLLIRNALKTSFLPSNITLPPTIHALQVKALTGTQNAVAILLNMSGGSGNPATVNNVFLGAGDDFAFAAGVDFVRSAFQSTIDQILSRPVPPVSFDISTLFGSIHITYTITLRNAAVALENGRIVLTINGHAHTGSRLPDFDFTVRQLFTLQPDGATANLVVGDISLHTSSWIVNQFTGGALSALGSLRDRAIAESGAVGRIRRMLSAELNLGGFLQSLLTPTTRNDSGPLPPQHNLAYTAVTISPEGIVLHGSLSVRAWPPAHVEFEQIPAQPRAPHGPHEIPTSGHEYSALKSWIPGGTIQSYEWKPLGQTQPGTLDDHKFVRLPPLALPGVALETVHAYAPLCLTVRGTRLSWTGPITAEPVTATVCAYDSFPVVTGDLQTASDGGPLVALTRSGPGGLVEIVGHAPAADAASRGPRPNLVVHFADAKTARRLDRLTDALRESRRQDAATGIVAVVAKADIAHAPYAPGIVYSDGHEHSWERALGTKVPVRPATLVFDPKGRAVWRHEGDIDADQLASVLRRVLVGGGPITTRTLKSNARIGHPPPNFLFEFAAGQQLTLRKLSGPVTIVFWRSTSQPSIEAVLRAQRTHERSGANGQTLLAINDGEPIEVAKRIAAEHHLPGILVTDPNRAISAAYGVNAWPLSISIDASGVITELSFGGLGETADHPVQQTPLAPPEKKGSM